MIARASVLWEQASREADLTVDLPGGVPMFFRRIPVGSFLMGSRGHHDDEEPIHRVAIHQPYYLGRFVVTQKQYRSVARTVDRLRHEAEPSHFKGEHRPVEQVDWREANIWCDALTQWMISTRHMPAGFERFCKTGETDIANASRKIKDTELDRAVAVLHEAFGLGGDEEAVVYAGTGR